MRKITFDIATQNTFLDVGANDPSKLAISVVRIHDSETDEYSSYEEHELKKLSPIIEKIGPGDFRAETRKNNYSQNRNRKKYWKSFFVHNF